MVEAAGDSDPARPPGNVYHRCKLRKFTLYLGDFFAPLLDPKPQGACLCLCLPFTPSINRVGLQKEVRNEICTRHSLSKTLCLKVFFFKGHRASASLDPNLRERKDLHLCLLMMCNTKGSGSESTCPGSSLLMGQLTFQACLGALIWPRELY